MTTYLELSNVLLDYEVDGGVTLKGVWLEKDGKELDITDFLTKADWIDAEQRAIEDYEAKCQDAADRADERGDYLYQQRRDEQ